MASHIDQSVHSSSVHTYRTYIHEESRVESCSLRHPSIHPRTVTAIRAHVIVSGAHVDSCDQLVPKGHVLLAVIKPFVSHA